MPILDRIGKLASGLWGGGREAIGLVQDLATAEWRNQEEFDSFAHWMRVNTQDRVATMAQRAFAPDEGFGAAIGGLPEAVRTPAKGVLDGLEWVYREGIAEPITTLSLLGSLSDSDTYAQQTGIGGLSGLVNPRAWADAHNLAQSMSPGQALYAMFATKDILNPDEMAEMLGSDLFHVVSGTLDMAGRFFLDPGVIAGKGAKAARLRYLVRPLKGADQIEDFFAGAGASRRALKFTWADMDSEIGRFANQAESVDQLAGRIRGRWFKNDPHGDIKAFALAAAPDTASREAAMRFFMGDMGQLERLIGYSDDLAERVAVLNAQADSVKATIGEVPKTLATTLDELDETYARITSVAGETRRLLDQTGTVNNHPDAWWRDMALFQVRNSPEYLQGFKGEMRFAGIEQNTLERLTAAFGSQATELRATRGLVRDAVVHSRFWQNTSGGRAVEVLTGMKPHHIIDLEDTTRVSEDLRRMLVEADFDTPSIEEWRGRIMGAGSPEERLNLWREAEQEGFRRLADEFGLSEADVADTLAKASWGRNHARAILQDPNSRAYSVNGVDLIAYEDADGIIRSMPMPLAVTQTPNHITGVDFRQLRWTLTRMREDGFLSPQFKDLAATARADPANIPAIVKQLPRELVDGIENLPQISVTKFAKMLEAKPVRLTREVGNAVSYYWKAGVLMRPGWTFRVVLMDEQLRLIWKFGAIASLSGLPKAVRNLGVRAVSELGWDTGKAARRGALVGGGLGFVAGGPVGAAVGAAALGGLPGAARNLPFATGLFPKLAVMDELGYGGVTAGGMQWDGPFGAPEDAANIYRGKLSQSRDVNEFLGRQERGLAQKFRPKRDNRNWGTVSPERADHPQAWEWAVNNQIGQDRLWRQALQGIAKGEDAGATMARMRAWLDTVDGEGYLRKVPWRTSDEKLIRRAGGWTRQSPEAWISSLYEEAHRLVGGSPTIAGAAARRSAKYDDLTTAVRNVADRPEVHGEVLSQIGGKSELMAEMDGFIQKGFRFLGGIPTDELSRVRAFAAFYREHVERLTDLLPDDVVLTPKIMASIEDGARRSALAKTRHLMYDLAERSEFGEMTRMLMPFFDAYREVLTRWAGLAIDNPAATYRAMMLWQGLDKLPGASYTDPESGERYLQFRIPEAFRWMVDRSPLFKDALDAQGNLTVPKEAFKNIPVFGGPEEMIESVSLTFGFGPWVQLAVSEVVQDRPDMEDSVQFILPYGASKDAIDAFLPAYARRARSSINEDDDQSYAALYRGILRTRMVQTAHGELDYDLASHEGKTAFLNDAKAQTDSLFRLRMFVNYVSPVAPIFETPYKPWIDAYRALQREGDVRVTDPTSGRQTVVTPDERFLQQYGEEFFAITQSMTKLNDGVPATVEGFEARKRYQDLIEKYPHLGGLIIGDEGGGVGVKFSQAMYQMQRNENISDVDSRKQRELRTPEGFITAPEVRLGWSHYMRAMDAIDAERVRRGLPNLAVKDAQDLAVAKKLVTEALEKQYPMWAEEKGKRDDAYWDRTLAGLQEVASDDRLAGRPDIAGLRQYLEAREAILGALAARKAAGKPSTMSAGANLDIAVAWESVVGQLTERNPAFAELYYRYLEGDPMLVSNSLLGEVASDG